MVSADHRDDVLLRDQAESLALALLGLALMIGAQELDLGAAEIREAALADRGQRRQFGIGAVDQLYRQIDRVERRLAGVGGISGQRIDGADLDVLR